MAPEEPGIFLQKIFSAKDNQALEKVYDQWAEQYDEHLTGFGYQIPAVAAGLLCRHLTPETTPILDAGAGTGMMGEILDTLGYQGQVGIDMSEGMLDMAAQRNVYAGIYQMVLGERLDFPNDHFSVCQSVGVFTTGHAPASAFDELVRVVHPDGHILFSLLEEIYEEKGFRNKFDELENEGKWQIVEKTKTFPGLPLEDPNLLHRVYIYRVN
ncbi:class I SAM-dependent DNA methyltransferase [Thermodesulfobacteriota bacterium]